MEKRVLGRTGLEVSCFGFGGIVVMNMEQPEANNAVAEAVDRGVNYFDVAPTYGDSQDRLGPALAPYRKRVHLACKTNQRTKKEAAAELHESLQLLQTDYFDVYQLHAVDTDEDIETIFGPDGAFEALLEAKEQGLIRFIGFSSHSQQAALTLMDRYDFDTVLFPINWAYWLNAGQGQKVINAAREENRGVIAIKGLAHRLWREGEERRTYDKPWYKPIFDDVRLAELALRFTLSQPVNVALSPGDLRMLRLGLDIADRFTPLTEAELGELRRQAESTQPMFDHRF